MNQPQLAPASTPAQAIVIDELIATVVPGLQRKLQQALASEGPQLVVDLEPLRVIDSAGIGLLIAAKNSVDEQQGQIRLLNVPAPVFNLLKTMRLIRCLNAELASNDSDSDTSTDSDDDLQRYFDEAQVA